MFANQTTPIALPTLAKMSIVMMGVIELRGRILVSCFRSEKRN